MASHLASQFLCWFQPSVCATLLCCCCNILVLLCCCLVLVLVLCCVLLCCASQELSAEACYKILSQISDEDCRALGFDTRFTRPDWLLVSVLPVPPPPVRPSVMMDSSAR